MKISTKLILAASLLLAFYAMAPAAFADSQQLVIGSTSLSVISSTVVGSTVDVTAPIGLYELGFALDAALGVEIPTMSLDFFAGNSNVPHEIETFSGVFVQSVSNSSGLGGLAQSDFTFTSSQTTYSGSAPEPSSLALLCAGLAGLMVVSRKKLLFS